MGEIQGRNYAEGQKSKDYLALNDKSSHVHCVIYPRLGAVC